MGKRFGAEPSLLQMQVSMGTVLVALLAGLQGLVDRPHIPPAFSGGMVEGDQQHLRRPPRSACRRTLSNTLVHCREHELPKVLGQLLQQLPITVLSIFDSFRSRSGICAPVGLFDSQSAVLMFCY